MIHFITYSNDLYSVARDFCGKMAKKKGEVDKVTVYTANDIDEDFREKYKDILSLKEGNGLWLWKPYFVLKTLEEASENDIVLYSDAGSFFFKSCRKMIESMYDDVWVSNIPLVEKQFTKPELLENLNCTDKVYTDTNQIQANFIAIRKTNRGIEFAKEWLEACCFGDNLLCETRYDAKPPGFRYLGHRSDQSVLSLLIKKWEITPHLDPSQYGRVPEKYYAVGRIYKSPDNKKEYSPCIILHRGRKPKAITCFKQWLCTWLPLWLIYLFSEPCRQVKKRNLGRGEIY